MQMEKKTVWITGADRGVGFSLCEEFLRGGWRVFAGRFMPEWTALLILSGVNILITLLGVFACRNILASAELNT